MPKPTARTGLSFAASNVTLGEGNSQTDSEIASQADEAFKLPNEPASVSQNRELASMKVQLDRLLQQMDEQGEESRGKEDAVKQQMQQQKEESKEREEESKKREESRKREDALERRLDQMMSTVARSAK
ncbi:hypothetical protein LTR62_001937 [Meristemomyces frigidus]|uniref:Uncharacterized protein n=1 Tax=Meristemomyces frigidus TaxID=1508187 RepID=A0AAN7TJG4_9PEZI|nr:hypothetical protein LTR62_001937 [Meristemomyces frigidus]